MSSREGLAGSKSSSHDSNAGYDTQLSLLSVQTAEIGQSSEDVEDTERCTFSSGRVEPEIPGRCYA